MSKFDDFLLQNKANLDKHQLQAVHCDVNCVVSAGAGSGKTTVLSYRFLRLVLEGKAEVGQILTLTFTRKAAREMQMRIHRHLLSFRHDSEIARQLAGFGEASISTLDSFCSRIVRSDCIRYGIAQDFVIDDEQNLKNARRCATELLDAWPQSEGARILSSLYSPDTLVDEVLVKLASNAYCLPKGLACDAKESILSAVESVYEQSWEQFCTLLDSYADLTDTSKTVTTAREAALLLRSALQSCPSLEEKHRILCSNLGYFRKPGAGKAEQLLYIKETVDELNQLRKKLCIALSVLLGSSRLEAVLTFMQTFIASYQMQKRRSGVLTFADVASLAVDILTENKSLRRYYKESYKYIMIDEFQDNNEQQKELLYLLAERMDGEGDTVPRPSDLKADKLFFVGDEKQSIYRFRGSDVSVFKRLSSELAAIGGRHIQLDTNYRSEPALIQWFNTLFPSVMQNDGEAYEADFSALGYRGASEGIQSKCTVLIKPYEAAADEDEEEAGDTEAEAFAVASLIDEMLQTDSYLIPTKEGPRRPQSSDIALLLRTTGNQLSFEKALRRFSIPYTVQAARSLMLEAPANDLYAMLQLLLYPQDRHAYMTVLRSPFCNLSDYAMAQILDGATLFEASAAIAAEDKTRLDAVRDFYQNLKRASAHASLSSLVSMLWYESGYYLSLVANPSYQVYAEHYTFLHRLAQMQQQQGKSLSQFVDFLRSNLAQNEKINDLDIIKEQEQGVQILSIHKSKGLEFPIVVVANTGSKGKAEEDLISTYQGIPIPHYLSVPFSVSETQIEAARHAGQLLDKGTEAQLNRAELKRLLYVALTRAETHLVVSGCFSRNNRSLADDGRASTLLLMLCQALGIDIDDPACEQGIVTVKRIAPIAESFLYDQGGEDEGAFARRIETAGTWYAQQNEPYDLRPIRYAVTSLHEPIFSETAKALPVLPSDALLGEALAADFGTFVHALCEALVQHDKAVNPEALLPPSLSGSMHKQVIADAQMLCDAFFSSSWYKKEVEPYSVSSEVGFFSVVEHEGREVVAEGSIDLLVKRDDHYLVVDFKTDRFRDEEVHRFQVETYMQAMRRIHQCPVKGCVVYLRDVQDIVIWEEET